MFLTQIRTNSIFLYHNSTESANFPPIYSKECKYQSYIKHNIYYHALVAIRNG